MNTEHQIESMDGSRDSSTSHGHQIICESLSDIEENENNVQNQENIEPPPPVSNAHLFIYNKIKSSMIIFV